MFKKNQQQFVNIIASNKQLKIDYRILQNNQIIKKDNSTFLLHDSILPQDVILKLNTLQENIPHTYLTTLYDSKDQEIHISNDCDDNSFEYIKLDDNSYIKSKKNSIMQKVGYFKDSGMDYLISPFSILNRYIKEREANSLNILLLNSSLYILIVDKDGNIAYGKHEDITTFEDIKNSKFYADEEIGKKLYEEIYFLEIQQVLSDIVQIYYQSKDNVEFLTKTNILFIENGLGDDQLDTLGETLMTQVSSNQIDINEVLYTIVAQKGIVAESFIEPRVKKDNDKNIFWIITAIVSVLFVVAILYLKLSSSSEQQKKPVKDKIVKKIVKKKHILLPNHTKQNQLVLEDILSIFDLIPYDGVIKELKMKENIITLVTNFIVGSKSIETLKESLAKEYKDVKIILQHNNKENTLTSVIFQAKDKKDIKNNKNIKNIEYTKFKYTPIAKVIKYLQKILIDGSSIKFVSKQTKDYSIFTFNVISYIKTPKEFFDMIETLNKNKVSISIDYPVEFSKLGDKIMVKYKVNFYQYNKKLK